MATLLLQVRSVLRSPRPRQTGRIGDRGDCFLVSPLTIEGTAGKFPAVAVSVLTLVCVFFAYSGLAKLHR